MATESLPPIPLRWELAAENIAVRIRWFGLIVGYVLVNVDALEPGRRALLNAILTLGAVYTVLDTWHSFRGRVFLGRYPLFVGAMEALFIGLLCYFHAGLDSPFRFYYILSLLCCAIRYASRVTYATWLLHCFSYTVLFFGLPPEERRPLTLLLTLVVLGWVTWAGDSLGLLLKRIGDYLGRLNAALRENQTLLEARIAERTQELQEAQAHLLHQEKMAAFGLLAAGIAHEVGNPLMSISALVQLLQKRGTDEHTAERLSLMSGQLKRIQTTLRELMDFSRPVSAERSRLALGEIIDEALNIAKYYQRTKTRHIECSVHAELPPLVGVRDQLVQVILNLVLNAVDATDKGGSIELTAGCTPDGIEVRIRDNGCGIAEPNACRIFQPYFTTKKNGTGLGLFVCRKLIADHDGTIAFESRPGEGTTFRVTLPATCHENSTLETQNAKLPAGH